MNFAKENGRPPIRCQIEPQPHDQFRFAIDGCEVTRWHFSQDAPRPYFFPVQGPSGVSLSRMGHPGAPNHDHHRSLWFAHHDLLGVDCWSDLTSARIEQTQWFCIDENDTQATLAVELAWRDGHDPAPLLHQTVFATLRPLSEYVAAATTGEWVLELQSDFVASAEGIEFRQSNYGMIALRVAKSISVVFGEGTITGADGRVGERELFGKPNRWTDYSGPTLLNTAGKPVMEGVALIDHRSNPGHGSDAFASWHIRDDGWMGPSLSRHAAVGVPTTSGLTTRYAIVVHAGPCNAEKITAVADAFDARPKLTVTKGSKPHHQYEIK